MSRSAISADSFPKIRLIKLGLRFKKSLLKHLTPFRSLTPIFTKFAQSSSARKSMLHAKKSKRRSMHSILILLIRDLKRKCGNQNQARFLTLHVMLASVMMAKVKPLFYLDKASQLRLQKKNQILSQRVHQVMLIQLSIWGYLTSTLLPTTISGQKAGKTQKISSGCTSKARIRQLLRLTISTGTLLKCKYSP